MDLEREKRERRDDFDELSAVTDRHKPDVETTKHVENIPLMHVYRDQGLELSSLHLVQVFGGLTDQGVEDVQELVVGLLHDLPVGP